MTKWMVETYARAFREVEVEADTLEEAQRKALVDSEAWADEQDGNVRFGTWAEYESMRMPGHEYADDCNCTLCVRVRIEDMG